MRWIYARLLIKRYVRVVEERNDWRYRILSSCVHQVPVMVAKRDDDSTNRSHLSKPPPEVFYNLWTDVLRLRVEDVSTDVYDVWLQTTKLFKEGFEHRLIFRMTPQSADPVNVSYVTYSDTRHHLNATQASYTMFNRRV